MPALSDIANSPFVKFMYVGDSSTGKTGSLVSLVKAGYKLRILDMDAGVTILAKYVKHECPERMAQVDYVSFRDDFKVNQANDVVVKGTPKAYVSAVKAAIEKWPNDDSIPAEWGTDTFFVLDTLTTFGKAALAWAEGMNPTSRDPRQWYSAAQKSIENFVSQLMGENFRTNVIIISHITERELHDGTTKGFPASGAGKALGPTLAKYCNTLVLAETSGFGEKTKRRIKTTPTGFIDLKTEAPFAMANEYPLETGLATIVETLKAN